MASACDGVGKTSSEGATDAATDTKTSSIAAKKKGQTLPELHWSEGPIAKVNGVEIPKSAFDYYYNRYRISMHKFPVLYPVGGEKAVIARVGKRIITEEIIRQQAKQQGITASDEEVKPRLDEVNDRLKRDPDYAEYHRMLGTTMDQWRAEAEVDVLREELLYKGLKGARDVPDNELKALYEERKDKYKHGDQVKVSRIRFDIGQNMTGDQIKLLRQKADLTLAGLKKKGAKFDEMAKRLSDGSSRERGGELGWVSRTGMAEPIADALWKTKVGQVTDVLQDERAMYIYKVEGFRKEGIAPLEDVRAELYLELQKKRQEDAVNKLIGEWKSTSKVEILNPDLQSAMTYTSTVMPEIPERDPAFEVKSGH